MAGGLSARPRGLRAGLGLAVLTGVLVVAGCSGSGSGEGNGTSATVASPPTTVTASSSEPTATASPTETSALPPLPEAAKENTPEGAEAFIRYYYDVANGLHEDPPPASQIETLISGELVDPECRSCDVLRDELREFATGGYRTTGPIYSVLTMEPIGGGLPGVQRFNMTMRIEEHVIERPSTGETYEREQRDVSGVGAASWDGEKWRTYDMELG